MHTLSKVSNNINGDKMVQDIMTKKIIYIKSDDTIANTSKKMLEFDIGFLPVEKNKKIIGVITDRDIATKVFSNTKSLDVKIEDYISKNIITINKESKLEEALFIMSKNKIKRLIVLDDRLVVGIISLSDILNDFNNNELLIKTLKNIFSINKNTDKYKTEIDEFYL